MAQVVESSVRRPSGTSDPDQAGARIAGKGGLLDAGPRNVPQFLVARLFKEA
jgi:hypothetical protein